MLQVRTEQAPWDRALNRAAVEFEIPEAARRLFLTALVAAPDVPLERIPIAELTSPALTSAVHECRDGMESGTGVAIIQPIPDLDARRRRVFAWVVANLFGEPLVQNDAGDRVIAVYARPGNRRVVDGARYHQSREGGGPHTDNVSIPEAWDYLVFSCIRPALIGGESILIDARAVHRELQLTPEALRILEGPFWWEYRGISESLFQAPIVTYAADGQPRFRYLRKYLESAHRRAADPLTDEQVWALDVLEALVDRTDLQWRTSLAAGEILVTVDSRVFHARTAFADATSGGPASVEQAAAGSWRFFDRVWARRRA
jgi:Taurine catabolism dioxygenase TauD, TfdA family